MPYAHFYTAKLWYPSNVAFASATYSVTIKAPELGNTQEEARSQQISRTRAGRVLVYDRGRNINNNIQLSFQDMPDSERSALVVFLGLVGWGGSKIRYQDHFGVIKVVRCVSDKIQYRDKGLNVRDTRATAQVVDVNETLWDFDLALLDLTNSPEEFEIDAIMSTALAIHIADTNHPHNPKVSTTVNTADGAKVIDSVLVDNYKTVAWLVTATNGAVVLTCTVIAAHDGTGAADATLVDFSVSPVASIGNVAPVSFTTSINGVAAAQTLRLQCSVTSNGWTVATRKLKV